MYVQSLHAVLLTASVVMAQVNPLVVVRLATEGGEQVDRRVSSSGMVISCAVEGCAAEGSTPASPF